LSVGRWAVKRNRRNTTQRLDLSQTARLSVRVEIAGELATAFEAKLFSCEFFRARGNEPCALCTVRLLIRRIHPLNHRSPAFAALRQLLFARLI